MLGYNIIIVYSVHIEYHRHVQTLVAEGAQQIFKL